MPIDDLRQALLAQARTGAPVSYRALAAQLRLAPPQTIQRLTAALEALMAEDAAAGRPLLAALCVSRLPTDLPGRGFFLTAQALGLFAGEPDTPAAREFHAAELRRVLDYYT
ncbi:hypothetical protein [Paracoccus sp. (in: a-proteobacteria)]|uniref:hypothetical protein n=1 Tax=Paracoccus sp. TaxID=267 RepID=UPI00321FE57A